MDKLDEIRKQAEEFLAQTDVQVQRLEDAEGNLTALIFGKDDDLNLILAAITMAQKMAERILEGETVSEVMVPAHKNELN